MSPSTLCTASQLLIAAILLLSLFPNFCTAWSIAPDCAAFPQVSGEMTGALNMAIYAKVRAANDPPRLGTSMADLLPAPNENDPDNLSLVQTWFQNVLNAASVPSPGGIVIHCSDAYLIPIDPANRKYKDAERGNTLVIAPAPPAGITPTNNACGDFVKAFTYPAGGQQVIILCSDSDKGALKSSLASLDQFRTSGNLKNEQLVQAKGLNALGMYLSTMILHELMHAASFAEQLKALQPAQFPAILPDQVNNQQVGEIYQYTPISGKKLGDQTPSGQPTANNLQHNADSFALLAASWYLPIYAWVNGECKTIGVPRQAPAQYPNAPTPPGPS